MRWVVENQNLFLVSLFSHLKSLIHFFSSWQIMSSSTKEYLDNDLDRILSHKILYELKCLFLVCLIGNRGIKVTYFFSQLYFILAKIKTKNWDLYVCEIVKSSLS